MNECKFKFGYRDDQWCFDLVGKGDGDGDLVGKEMEMEMVWKRFNLEEGERGSVVEGFWL